MKNWTLKSDIKSFLEQNPQFQVVASNDATTLKGRVILENEDGYMIDFFDVFMVIPQCYPKCFPLVWEKSNKIPHHIDWHVVVGDMNRLCIIEDSEERLVTISGISLNWFLEKALKPYLAGQAYRLRNPGSGYPQGERPHNIEGNMDFFMEFLEINNLKLVVKLLEVAASPKSPGKNHSCICGSGKKFKRCHLQKIEDLRQIGTKHLRRKIQNLTNQ